VPVSRHHQQFISLQCTCWRSSNRSFLFWCTLSRWQSLRTVLEAVVETGGDMLQYRQRWAAGRWWWLSGANQAAVYGGPQREMTCTKALREGLVD
jgi:hypothetical protein